MPKSPGRVVRYLLVATYYFTKWVKAKLLVHIITQDVNKFIWEDVICRFGIPHTIISTVIYDKAKQFVVEVIHILCNDFSINHNFSAPYHPQAKCQAGATNKAFLDPLKNSWILLSGIGSNNSRQCYRHIEQHQTLNLIITFSSCFWSRGYFAVRNHGCYHRTICVEEGSNDQALLQSKALLDENGLEAIKHILKYQEDIKKCYDK